MNTKKHFACIHFDSHNQGMNKEHQPPATYSVRIPAEMRRQLEESARASGRSLHAEILLRLGDSLGASKVENSVLENDLEEKIRAIALEIVREELRKSGVAPEHETGFSIPMQKRHY